MSAVKIDWGLESSSSSLSQQESASIKLGYGRLLTSKTEAPNRHDDYAGAFLVPLLYQFHHLSGRLDWARSVLTGVVDWARYE